MIEFLCLGLYLKLLKYANFDSNLKNTLKYQIFLCEVKYPLYS